jgi:uroporphyrinogen III methyltransferase/synthase
VRRLSLKGKVIAITRPEKQAHELAELVSKLGGKPYVVPTVEIKPPRNRRSITQLINKILNEQMDFVIFMSVNGVTSLIESSENLVSKAKFIEKLDRAIIVAVGPKTRRELEKHGVKVDIVPLKYSSEGIAESFKKLNITGKTVAIPRSSKSSMYLTQELEKLGANVLEVPIYECALPTDRSKVLAFINDLLKGEIDVVTFTSSFTARNLFKIASEYALTDEFRECLAKPVIAAIGPTTQRTLEELGVKVDVVPKEYTIEAMMDAVVRYVCHDREAR